MEVEGRGIDCIEFLLFRKSSHSIAMSLRLTMTGNVGLSEALV